jgi:CDP-glucose 4,6-dehydratase
VRKIRRSTSGHGQLGAATILGSLKHALGGRRVFVTGATGLIGSHLTLSLIAIGAEVHAFVVPEDESGSLLNRSDARGIQRHTGRLEDQWSVARAIGTVRPEIVFHLGAQTQVGRARQDPPGTFATNVAGTWHVLEACRSLQPRPVAIAVASSDKAYGRSDKLPYRETYPLAGIEPYEVSKTMTDLLAQTYAASYGLPTRIARCGNVYGAGDLNWDRIVPGTIRSLLHGERPIIRSDGTPIRDYVHVADVVDAYLRLASADLDSGTAFNFSSGERASVLAVVQLIATALGSNLRPDIRGDATGELAEQYLDATKATKELGWRPSRRMAESMPEIVEWYRTVP